ncbi:MAG: four helix bundle protein [Gemmatimonadales bacterium]
MSGFQHEKLEVYHLAVEFMSLAVVLAERIPRHRWFLADQLLRAAASVVLNIAEGAAEFSAREKARFYRIARRSAAECAGALDVLRTMKMASPREVDSAKDLLDRIAGKLTSMIKSVEARRRGGSDRQSPRPRARPRPRPRPEA